MAAYRYFNDEWQTSDKYWHCGNTADLGNGSNEWWKLPRLLYMPLEDYLAQSQDIQSNKVRIKLLKEGYKEPKCERCNLTHWLDCPIPLELHHKDGNRHNNVLENYELLCPNCHALTDTYRGKNVSK